ncbi:MAG: hypothetical protein MUO27_05735, partial [Sedimentisphaerales bacterium]|nr:hypothetical protein [Sedimentisphaerales bacterium]
MMRNSIKLKTMVIVMVFVAVCSAASCAETPAMCPSGNANSGSVDNILKDLQNAVSNLKSYQCKIEYLFSQPLLESKTQRKGLLYYAKSGDKSKLRINFDTLKQDEEPEQKHIEHY